MEGRLNMVFERKAKYKMIGQLVPDIVDTKGKGTNYIRGTVEITLQHEDELLLEHLVASIERNVVNVGGLSRDRAIPLTSGPTSVGTHSFYDPNNDRHTTYLMFVQKEGN